MISSLLYKRVLDSVEVDPDPLDHAVNSGRAFLYVMHAPYMH